jgi:hypothetical protein
MADRLYRALYRAAFGVNIMPNNAIPGIQHPAPERGKASLRSLLFSLAAPPLAWSVQSIAGYGISSEACYPGDTPRTVPLFSGMWGLLLMLNVAALVIGVIAISVAYRNWNATRRETGGDSQHLIERGEGRTRFVAMWGLFLGSGFVLATVFSSIALLISPLCR